MKQTAVEWLEERFEKFLAYYEGHHKAEMYSIHQLSNDFDQAKEMEKQQIIQSNRDGVDMIVNEKHFITGEQYYNETFKNQLQG